MLCNRQLANVKKCKHPTPLSLFYCNCNQDTRGSLHIKHGSGGFHSQQYGMGQSGMYTRPEQAIGEIATVPGISTVPITNNTT